MINAIIIDDEERARLNLKAILRNNCPQVQLIGEADGVFSGIELLSKKALDILFLDVQMMDGNGFELLDKLGKISFQIIFVTGYNEFAIKAFRYSALDYILKPISPRILREALDKIRRTGNKSPTAEQVQVLNKGLNQNNFDGIILSNADGLHYIELDEVIRCKGEGSYTHFYMANGKRIVVSKPLNTYVDILSPPLFYRVHQSHIVNMRLIKKVNRSKTRIILKNNEEVELSRLKKEDFLNTLGKISRVSVC